MILKDSDYHPQTRYLVWLLLYFIGGRISYEESLTVVSFYKHPALNFLSSASMHLGINTTVTHTELGTDRAWS